MKKYIIAITLFCLSLILIDDAYALNTKGWGFNLNTSSRVYAYDCTSANTCNTSLTVNTSYVTDFEDNFVQGVESYISGVANDNGGLGFVWAFNVANPLKAGYLYNVTGYFCNNAGTNIHLNNIISGNSLSDITGRSHPLTYNSNGAVNEISNMPFADGTGKGKCHYISRFIVPSTNSQYIGMQIGSDDYVTTTWSYYGYTLTELGAYNAVTKDDLNSAIKNSGLASADSVEEVEESVQNVQENINSSIQESTDNINNSIQESTDNINQGIKDGFENCRDSNNLLNVPSIWNFIRNTNVPTSIPAGTYHITTGKVTKGGANNPVLYIGGKVINLMSNMNITVVFDNDVTSYSYYSNGYNWGDSAGITSTVENLMISVSGGKYEPYGEQVCSNRIDETNQQLQQTNDFLTSDEAPNSDISVLGNVQGLLPPGPVDSLLNIPFYFLSVVNSSMGGVCVPISGKFVFDSTLTLPCFGDMFYNNVPDYLMNFLSLIPGSFILIKYFKHLYKKVNRAVSLESNVDDEWGVL